MTAVFQNGDSIDLPAFALRFRRFSNSFGCKKSSRALKTSMKRQTSFLKWPGIFLFLLLGSTRSSQAANVLLSWNANTEPDLAGYKVYYGNSSRNYGTPINAGNATSYTVTGLTPGTFFFAITAYDTSGNESGFSAEASLTVTATSNTTRCDMNGDGTTNTLDLQAVINEILSAGNSATYDINHDGAVNVLDLQLLGNVILGVGACP